MLIFASVREHLNWREFILIAIGRGVGFIGVDAFVPFRCVLLVTVCDVKIAIN